MNSSVVQVADNQWHAIADDLVVGRGYASRRLDGRVFVSVDTWQDSVFDQLAAAMVVERPVYTVVDEADHDLTANWRRAGFEVWRREVELVVPTGAPPVEPPPGVTITADVAEDELRELDQRIRSEVDWRTMPAEVLPWQGGTRPLEPANYTVAVKDGRYVGMIRLATRTRRPRIGLVAVLAVERRQGIARALLGHALAGLRRAGFEAATAEVDETNTAALALFKSAHRTGGAVELERV